MLTLSHFWGISWVTLASYLPLSCAPEEQTETRRAPRWPWSSGRSSFCCSLPHHENCFGKAARENPGSQSGGWKRCCCHPSWSLGLYLQTDHCCSPVGPLEASSAGYEGVLFQQHPAYPGGLHGTTTQSAKDKLCAQNSRYNSLVWKNVSSILSCILPNFKQPVFIRLIAIWGSFFLAKISAEQHASIFRQSNSQMFSPNGLSYHGEKHRQWR